MPRWARSIAIPPPRLVPWTMKNVDSARTELRFLPDARLHLHIRHDVLRGVTPTMLVWWFQHLEGTIEVGGRTWPRYHVWHPVDHIAVRYARRLPDGSVGPGAQIHIQASWRNAAGRPAHTDARDSVGLGHEPGGVVRHSGGELDVEAGTVAGLDLRAQGQGQRKRRHAERAVRQQIARRSHGDPAPPPSRAE